VHAPNVGAVPLVSLGCESFNRRALEAHIRASGRPAATLVIQESGGTRRTIARGAEWVEEWLSELDVQIAVPMALSELVVGTVCGGSDGTSGITANPAMGRAFDLLIERGAPCIFEETGELVGASTTWRAARRRRSSAARSWLASRRPRGITRR
jgi:altronate hydrolase